MKTKAKDGTHEKTRQNLRDLLRDTQKAQQAGRMGPPYTPYVAPVLVSDDPRPVPKKIALEGRQTIPIIPREEGAGGRTVNLRVEVVKTKAVVKIDDTKTVEENARTLTREQCLLLYRSTNDVQWMVQATAKMECSVPMLAIEIGATFPFDRNMKDHAVITALLRDKDMAAWREWRRWCLGQSVVYGYDMCYNNVVTFMETVRTHVKIVYGYDFVVREVMDAVAQERRNFFQQDL